MENICTKSSYDKSLRFHLKNWEENSIYIWDLRVDFLFAQGERVGFSSIGHGRLNIRETAYIETSSLRALEVRGECLSILFVFFSSFSALQHAAAAAAN